MSKFSKEFGNVEGEMFIPGDKIAAGAYGTVYSCLSLKTGEEFAVKIEEPKDDASLAKESEILKQLAGSEGIPKYQWFGSTEDFNMLVIERLGDSLAFKMRQFKDRKVRLELTLNVALQCVSILESMHSKGFVHGDIKPTNILFGRRPSDHDKIYLVDFGFSTRYKTTTESHVAPLPVEHMVGTVMFASVTAHECVLLSRKDDLISLGYTMLYLFSGTLPWIDHCRQQPVSRSNMNMVYKMKRELHFDPFFENVPNCIKEFLLYSSNLMYYETPSYEYLRSLIQASIDTIAGSN